MTGRGWKEGSKGYRWTFIVRDAALVGAEGGEESFEGCQVGWVFTSRRWGVGGGGGVARIGSSDGVLPLTSGAFPISAAARGRGEGVCAAHWGSDVSMPTSIAQVPAAAATLRRSLPGSPSPAVHSPAPLVPSFPVPVLPSAAQRWAPLGAGLDGYGPATVGAQWQRTDWAWPVCNCPTSSKTTLPKRAVAIATGYTALLSPHKG